MAGNRKDSKGRVLRKGEYERVDGRYYYVYTDAAGKRGVHLCKRFKGIAQVKTGNRTGFSRWNM